MSLNPTIGYMKPESDRATWWHEIYGSLEIPLKSPITYQSKTGVDGATEDYYQIDIDRLSYDQVEKICALMADTFDTDIEIVRAGVRGEHGVPVRASEIEGLTFDARLVL